jgi:hypothetical protein
MNDIQKIASEVATFYHALVENGVDAYTASMLTGTFLTARMQYGKFPEDSPIIPIPIQVGDLTHE